MSLTEHEIVPEHYPGYVILSSYLYYHKDYSLFTDNYFDMMCKHLLDNYHLVTNHRCKSYVNILTEENLRCGSLYHLREDCYPLGIRYLALEYI